MQKFLRSTLISTAVILLYVPFAGKPSLYGAERFVDNKNGTVTDTARQLMWQKGDNGEEVTFERAKGYCRQLRLGGHADWRLPGADELDTATVVELLMPMHSREAYARFDLYWSSDPAVLIPFNYHPARGAVVERAYPTREGDRAYVRAVRSTRTVKP